MTFNGYRLLPDLTLKQDDIDYDEISSIEDSIVTLVTGEMIYVKQAEIDKIKMNFLKMAQE